MYYESVYCVNKIFGKNVRQLIGHVFSFFVYYYYYYFVKYQFLFPV